MVIKLVATLWLQASIARGLAYAPYADMLWMETSTPSLEEAREFADAIHAKYPGMLCLHCCVICIADSVFMCSERNSTTTAGQLLHCRCFRLSVM